MADRYYIRTRDEENPKRWQGPFALEQLKDLAEQRLFSKDHEYSLDRRQWTKAKTIWPTLFPKPDRPAPTSRVEPDPKVASESKVVPDAKAVAKKMASAAAAVPVVPPPVPPAKPVLETAAAPEPEMIVEANEWYYALWGKQHGPVTISRLRSLIIQKRVQTIDLVWAPSCGDKWAEARDVRDLVSVDGVPLPPQIDVVVASTSSLRWSLRRLTLLASVIGLMTAGIAGYVFVFRRMK